MMNLRPIPLLLLLVLPGCGGSDSEVATNTPSNNISATGNFTRRTPIAVTFTVSPASIASGGTSVISWQSSGARTCTASGAWSGAKTTSGSLSVKPTQTSTYTLSCSGSAGSATKSVTVSVQTTAAASTSVTQASASKQGPYTIASYTSGIAGNASYSIPKIWYPTNGKAPYAAVVFIPGYEDSYTDPAYPVTINGQRFVEADFQQWATFLASQGFVVMFINPADLLDNADDRGIALSAAVNALAAENTRSGSPLAGKLLVNKIAVMGHSYGGGGALLAANARNNSHIAAVLALSPIPSNANNYSGDTLPTMVISAVGDPYMSDFSQFFNRIPSTTTKVLANFKSDWSSWQSMHHITLTPLGTHLTDPEVARLSLSFLEVYLYGDTRYKPFLVNSANLANFSYVNP